MANAKPASSTPPKEPKVDPTVVFIGEGAEKIKFTVDPKAKRTEVHSNGIVVTVY